MGAELTTNLFFHIAKVAPAMGRHQVRNGHARKPDDFLIQADDLPVEQGCQLARNRALPGAAIADEYDIIHDVPVFVRPVTY